MELGHGPDYKADLLALVERLRPSRLLCIGPEAPILAPYAEAAPERGLISITEEDPTHALSGSGRFDFAYLSRTLEFMDKPRARALLSRLRDLHARYLALLVPIGARGGQRSTWASADLLALGMVRQGSYREPAGVLHLYTFDLATYKVTPDWFNPKHWAHPERWDKEWW